MIKNDNFLRALKRQAVDRTPVWLMRQAGRYLPEYRQTRSQAGDFLTLCKSPALAREVTLQPLKRFDLDAAILFSDILTIPDAMGLGLYFSAGEGPKFKKTVRSASDLATLPELNIERDLSYVFEAVDHIKTGLENRVPLIGFSGSPWTLAAYMVEGRGSRDFATLKQWLYTDPNGLEKLLSLLSDAVSEYLLLQIKAGVNAVQIFDTWGGLLSSHLYPQFSLAPMQHVVSKIKETHPDIPVILFTKGGGQWLPAMAQSGADALGVDWMTDLKPAFQQVGAKVALQGNLDPSVLLGSSERLQAEVQRILSAAEGFNGHVFNLGHGITPQANPERVAELVGLVHQG